MAEASENLSVLLSRHVPGFAVASDSAGAAPSSLYCARCKMAQPSSRLLPWVKVASDLLAFHRVRRSGQEGVQRN